MAAFARVHTHAMNTVYDPERGPDAKALYVEARIKMNHTGERREILRIAAETKVQIREMYENSYYRGHDDQLLCELIDYLYHIRVSAGLKN